MNSASPMQGNLAQTGYSRLSIQECTFGCAPVLEFMACVKVGGFEDSNGEPTRIECPDPSNPDSFYTDSYIRGERGLMTTDIMGRLGMKGKSRLRALRKANCPIDLHIRFGRCAPLDHPTNYTIGYIIPHAMIEGYTLGDLGALEQSERAVIEETITAYFDDYMEISSYLEYSKVPASVVGDAPMVGVTICDRKQCCNDACGPASSGCGKIYAIDTACKVYMSNDGGTRWQVTPMLDGCCSAEPVGRPLCLCDKLVVVEADGTIAWITRNDLDAGNVDGWLHQLTSINSQVTGVGQIGDYGFVLTANGQVHIIHCGCGVQTMLVYNGVAHGATPLNAISFAPSGRAVAVGDNGVSIYSDDYTFWKQGAGKPTTNNLISVVAKNDVNWLVGGENADLWCTDTAGCFWTRDRRFPCDGLSTAGPITHLTACNSRVLWGAYNGYLWRSVDAGANWVLEPNQQNAAACRVALKSMGAISQLACCEHNLDFIVGVGTGADGKGLIVVGTA